MGIFRCLMYIFFQNCNNLPILLRYKLNIFVIQYLNMRRNLLFLVLFLSSGFCVAQSDFRLSLEGGYGYRTAKISNMLEPEFQSYYKKMKFGPVFSGGLTCFFRERIGLGLRFSNFYAKNSKDNVIVTYEDGSTAVGIMKDNIRISFIGPELDIRIKSRDEQNVFIIGIAAGVVNYRNHGELIEPITITSKTGGLHMSFDWDHMLNRNLSIGLRFNSFTATLTSITYDYGFTKTTVDLEAENFDNLYRMDLSAGLRLWF